MNFGAKLPKNFDIGKFITPMLIDLTKFNKKFWFFRRVRDWKGYGIRY